ncbi:DUF397 domain-containing protein [Actinomadura atramentaria]|uniref:DUF397 domain-containing protein n=1 Tax=Actinomadura atramentaria TaxID=1990 RepID=UPI00036C4976|nr:DUF397 domain-containing protein [Actinomadura atramentaria]
MASPTWRKATRSTATKGGDCAEPAALPSALGVRDSTHPDAGHLAFPAAAAPAFLTQAKSGVLDARR